MKDFIEFENPDDPIKRLRIRPEDTLEEIAKKMMECRKRGIRVTAVFNRVSLDNKNFSSIKDIKESYNEKIQVNESTNTRVGSFASDENITKPPSEDKDISTIDGTIEQEMRETAVEGIIPDTPKESISYIEVKQNETIEDVAKRLEKCHEEGIKAVALFDDVILDNVSTSSSNEIITAYKEQRDINKALNDAGIILERGFKYESKFKVNAREIRVGKYDRIQEIIQKLKFCRDNGIAAFVNFNGVQLNSYDYINFRLDDPYRIMKWYENEQKALRNKEKEQARSAQEIADSSMANSQINSASSIDSSINNLNSIDQGAKEAATIAIGGTAYQLGSQVDDALIGDSSSRFNMRTDSLMNQNIATPRTDIPAMTDNNKGGISNTRSEQDSKKQASQEQAQKPNDTTPTAITGKDRVAVAEEGARGAVGDAGDVSVQVEAQVPKNTPGKVSGEATAKIKRETNVRNKLLYDPDARNMRRISNMGATDNDVDDEDDIPAQNEGEESETTPNDVSLTTANIPDENEEGNDSPKATSNNEAPKKKKKKKDLKKLIWQFIKKHPYVLAAVGGAAIFLLILVFFLEAPEFNGTQTDQNQSSSSYSSTCDAIDLHNTSMTRSEFITKTQEYYAKIDKDYAKVFSSNAGTIYDVATKNGINPEMVIVRAESEGYSPGASKNNYWGMGCTNSGGYQACISYKSFSDSVLGYVKNISKYDSVSAMMSKYAYIGSYWYKNMSGGSSKGGCYYYEYIKQFMDSSRATEVEQICGSSNNCNFDGSGNCVATTDADQLAYAKWQVYKMAGSRERIFGIPPDECKTPTISPGCVLYAQSDPKWGSIHLGKSSSTMSGSGCAVTSIAIGIKCSGTQIADGTFDAGVFIRKLNSGSCFTESGAIYWDCKAITEIAPNVKLKANIRQIKSYTPEQKKEMASGFDAGNTFVLLHFKNSQHPRGHYVVFTSISGNNFIVKDPAGGKISQVPVEDIDQIVAYSY